jgi:hypothetical protein
MHPLDEKRDALLVEYHKDRTDSTASYRVAIDAVYHALTSGLPLDAVFIDETASKVHSEWLLRNSDRIREEIAVQIKERGYTNEEAMNDAELRNRFDELEPYPTLTEENKERDRE